MRIVVAACSLLISAGGCSLILGGQGQPPDAGDSDDSGMGPDANREAARVWINPEFGNLVGPVHQAAMEYFPPLQAALLYGGTDVLTGDGVIRNSMLGWDGNAWSDVCAPCDGDGPGRRFRHRMVYDEANQRLLLFGGAYQNEKPGQTDELYQFKDGVWSLVPATGDVPGSRADYFMAYDRLREQTVLFGGRNYDEELVADTYVLSATNAWTRYSSEVGPAARFTYSSSATYNGDLQSVVIYGGEDNTGQFLDDMWRWVGHEWRPVCQGCTGTARAHAGLIFDRRRRELLLIGGYDGAGEIGGTWAKVGDEEMFAVRDAMNLGARDGVALTYDNRRDVIIVHGGNGSSCLGVCDETWEYISVP